MVFLAERQIGAELAKGQAEGEVAKRGRPRKTTQEVDLLPATIREVGLSHKESQAYQQLAEAPAAAIDHAVAQANAEQRPVTKADLKKAVEQAVGFKDPRP